MASFIFTQAQADLNAATLDLSTGTYYAHLVTTAPSASLTTVAGLAISASAGYALKVLTGLIKTATKWTFDNPIWNPITWTVAPVGVVICKQLGASPASTDLPICYSDGSQAVGIGFYGLTEIFPTSGVINFALPTVSVSAPGSIAEGASGNITFTRTGNTSSALTVNYALSGTATSGVDYTALSGTVTIAAAATSAVVSLSALTDSLTEGAETVIITISSSAGYAIGTGSATVNITDVISGDPYLSSVSMLLRFNVANVFTDIANNAGLNINNGSGYESVTPIFGAKSALLNSDSFNVSMGTSVLLSLPGDFTIELSIKPTSFLTSSIVAPLLGAQSSVKGLQFSHSTKRIFFYDNASSLLLTSTTVMVANTIYHVAVKRAGSSMSLWINGVQEATATNSSTIDLGYSYMGGSYSLNNSSFRGLIDNVRVTKGVARNVSIPPTAEFPNT